MSNQPKLKSYDEFVKDNYDSIVQYSEDMNISFDVAAVYLKAVTDLYIHKPRWSK